MDEKYEYYASIAHAVDEAIAAIQDLPKARCFDPGYLEHTLIPHLGLNDEFLEEQPPELSEHFGKGLHLWQYPCQLARYMVWLSHNAGRIRNYTEIGCRWGGTFILVNEWLKKIGAPIEFSLALDPIEPTPFIQRYMEISSTPVHYIKDFSSSTAAMEYFNWFKPDMVFIDGDHAMHAVMFDHLLFRKTASIIVHHDVASSSCHESSLFWSFLKQAETSFEVAEFAQQYASVPANYLGIGVLKRR